MGSAIVFKDGKERRVSCWKKYKDGKKINENEDIHHMNPPQQGRIRQVIMLSLSSKKEVDRTSR